MNIKMEKTFGDIPTKGLENFTYMLKDYRLKIDALILSIAAMSTKYSIVLFVLGITYLFILIYLIYKTF